MIIRHCDKCRAEGAQTFHFTVRNHGEMRGSMPKTAEYEGELCPTCSDTLYRLIADHLVNFKRTCG